MVDHFSGHVSVWGPDGLLEQGGNHDADAVLIIGSLSKQFAAVTALTLVDEGRLDLDAPVATYFDDVPDDAWTLDGEACTVARLLRATCGLPRHVWTPGDELGYLDDPALGRAYLHDLAQAPLAFPPGSEHLYSNAGYVLAGLLVAEVAGAPYPQVLRERLLDPLGLADTGLGPAQLAPVEDRALAGQMYALGWWDTSWLGLGPATSSQVGAAGGMHSTGRDLARWTRAVHTGAVLSPASYQAWITPAHDDYAMGVVEGKGRIWHNGALSPHG